MNKNLRGALIGFFITNALLIILLLIPVERPPIQQIVTPTLTTENIVTATSTNTFLYGSINTDSTCHSRTSNASTVVTILSKGIGVLLIGKDGNQPNWLLIRWGGTTDCWVETKNISTSFDFGFLQIIPTPPIFTLTPRIPTITPTYIPIELRWKVLSYDCNQGKGTGILIDLDVSGGVLPYTFIPDMPLYAEPDQVVSVHVYSNTVDSEPKGYITFTVPSASDKSVFKC